MPVPAVALVAAFVGWQLYKKLTTNTVTAYFTDTLALYPGDKVQIMGVQVGRIDAIDPDGDIQIQLGPDGRLLSLAIGESVPGRLTHLALEEKLNDLLARANVVAQESWKASR